ncbi:MAG: hypothetical protein J0H39_09065 [Alphaproteobacteria bacterium]|nr:hypothetical protein [Alphaproteobacteria bacterium]
MKKLNGSRRQATVARYDDALPLFTQLVLNHLGEEALAKNCFLRDAEGNLTFVHRDELPSSKLSRLSHDAKLTLGPYLSGQPVCTPFELLDDELVNLSNDKLEFVSGEGFEIFVRLVERRIVGQDWVRGISPPIKGAPPIVVFASHKGGVGRSTALAVAAAEFASRGHSILAIDADLEAPGLGEMFILENEQPEFGVLDYFVENGRGTVDKNFLKQMLAPSALTRGRGNVLVVPAVGRRCRRYPQNVIGKISRAYLDDMSSDGRHSLTLLDQMRRMIKDLCARQKFDAIFVDARAGLNETTAATVQGLGAEILLFGVDTPQTWDGYRYFLAHLARFKPEDKSEDWRFRLKMIHAKATSDRNSEARFRDNAFELFAERFYDEIDESDAQRDDGSLAFGFDLDDRTAPHYAWPIKMNKKYYEFDPVDHPQQLDREQYFDVFGEFIESLAERLRLK